MFKLIEEDPSYLFIFTISATIVLVVGLRLFRAIAEEGLIKYLKDDWTVRLPYRAQYNRYRGLSRPSYVLLCILYYLVKDLFLFVVASEIVVLKFLVWDLWKWLFTADKRLWFQSLLGAEENEEDDEEDDCIDEKSATPLDDTEELPFCQLFKVGPDMCLLVDHVEMCPDEVAFIRVVDDEGYTPLYKRKVRRDKKKNRYLIFNSANYYLDDRKTQPVITKK